MNWREPRKIARHWEYDPSKDTVNCHLCPNECRLREDKIGICKVRKRSGEMLYSLNYGYCVTPTIETIETEAVFHFRPGARILNMGNIGCNLKCSFCQNWESSQVQHLDDHQVQYLSPEETVELALANNISIISWTYNDPVVWHEFVVETSLLAKKQGITILYKSALNINPEPLRELFDCVDIFSISLKTMDPAVYKSIVKGSLDAVLEGIKLIHQTGIHLEVSQLVVTGLNDTDPQAIDTINWILKHLGRSVPLHFVGYHPAYKYHEERTDPKVIHSFVALAGERGIRHSYSGNLVGSKAGNTYCQNCDHLLVERQGYVVEIPGLNADSTCKNCKHPSPIIMPRNGAVLSAADRFEAGRREERIWDGHNAYHLLITDGCSAEIQLRIIHLPDNISENIILRKGLKRILISRKSKDEKSFEVEISEDHPFKLLPILDRAHFPF